MKALTKRWVELPRIQPVHRDYFNSDARFIVVPAGRRSYKTEIAKRRTIIKSLIPKRVGSWFVFAAPTRDQAKRIFWKDVKALIPEHLRDGRPSESELVVPLVNGARVSVEGMDKPERIEGSMLDGIVLDEYANMKKDAFDAHVRPALADTLGWALFVGVPEGRNHYYELYRQALEDETGQWAVFKWLSSLVIDPLELQQALLHWLHT